MKSNKSKIAFFVVGLGIFVYLVSRFGVDQIFTNIERAGWSLLYIIVVWLVVYLLNTLAWKLVLGSQGNAISFRRLFMVTVSGFVINYITPVVAIGGEPYRVRALSGTLGTEQSVSAVVLYRMVHLLGHMLLLLTGILAALVYVSLPFSVEMVLLLAGLLVLMVIIITLSGHREGIFQRLNNTVARFRVLRRLSSVLQDYERELSEIHRVNTGIYRHERAKFTLSILLEYVSRICMGLEVYLILHGVGVEITPVSALFVYVTYSIIINMMFFIPLSLGSREGGLLLGLGSLALPPLLGVYLGVVMRIREFFWIMLGLLFILLTSEKEKAPVAKPV